MLHRSSTSEQCLFDSSILKCQHFDNFDLLENKLFKIKLSSMIQCHFKVYNQIER